jgi:hypothetical protein
MPTPTIQWNQGINLESLEALMDQGTTEDKRSIKNRIANHHQKALLLVEQRLHQLEQQKNNQWRGALFGFFIGILSQGIQALDLVVPTLGTGLSKALAFLQELNPFSHKAESAQLDAEKTEAEMQQEEAQVTMNQEYLKNLEDHEAQMKQRLVKTQENLASAQEAAVRI